MGMLRCWQKIDASGQGRVSTTQLINTFTEMLNDESEAYKHLHQKDNEVLYKVVEPSDPNDPKPLYLNQGSFYDVENFSFRKTWVDFIYYIVEAFMILVMIVAMVVPYYSMVTNQEPLGSDSRDSNAV